MQRTDGKVEGVWKDGSPVPELARLEFDDLIARLSERKHAFTRYQILDEIGRGGMGRVLRVLDVDMHRELAMKVLRNNDASLLDSSTSSDKLQMHARFLEEAQVAGQLDHPGIAPVHDIGLDADGRIYFTMKLVRGRTLQQVLKLVETGEDNWSLTRVLNVLLRVCEAMGYAHERGVLHRDLKPANVMVGGHGEIYVMDWGLARVLGRADPRAPTSGDSELGTLRTARRGSPETDAFSAFLTEDGRVLGTPAYMSPEQASGDGALVTAASDVYSIGAILYQALTGVAPYSSKPGDRPDNRVVWMQLQQGPPKKVAEFRRDVPPELVAVCEKAMQRDVALRYGSMAELAEDLRAYLELRVVRAYRSGPLTELKKWIGRNRTAAMLLSVLVVVVAGSGFFGAWREKIRTQALALRADAHAAATLVDRADRLWPVKPAKAPEMDAWLVEARGFVAATSGRAGELARFEEEGRQTGRAHVIDVEPDLAVDEEIQKAEHLARVWAGVLENEYADDNRDNLTGEDRDSLISGRRVLPAEVRWWSARANELKSTRRPRQALEFEDAGDKEAHSTLATLVENRARLEQLVRTLSERVQRAAGLRQESIESHAGEWKLAIQSIADRGQCPLYDGLAITPQLGLIPLRRDAASGLWEFWHVLSGTRPAVGSDGRYAIEDGTGMVFVLIPGGVATGGAQSADKTKPRYDEDARATETVRTARLEPYFISKYEMTQSQWFTMTGEMPSRWYPGTDPLESPMVERKNPVEYVNWHDAVDVLARFGCVLPTELQWEWAARAGTEERYGTAHDFAAVEKLVNFADASYARGKNIKSTVPLPYDGSRVHLPVDSYVPNGFGLHCVMGNVIELCADAYADDKDPITLNEGTGENTGGRLDRRSARGGGFANDAPSLRVSARANVYPDQEKEDVGIRAARPVEP